MKKIKSLFVLLLIAAQLFLTGCWNSREVNTLGFITAMGFDKSENGFKLTIQVFNPRAIASQKAVLESPIVVYTQEGKDLFEMIRRMVTNSPRKLNATHLEAIVFSEDFAKDGITGVLDYVSREHQFRADFYYVITKGVSANDILSSITKFETNSSVKLDACLKASESVWAATKTIKLTEIINSITADGKDAVLTGVALSGTNKADNSIDGLKESTADPIQLEGLAVFNKDKFVGWLNENESKGYNYIINNVKGTVGYVEDPKIGQVTLETTQADEKSSVTMENGKPAIQVSLKVKANIENIDADLDISDHEILQTISHLSSEKIKYVCYQSIEKAKEYKCDIFGFGEAVRRAYPSAWKGMKENWREEFVNLPVTINVQFDIIQTGTNLKSYFMKGND